VQLSASALDWEETVTSTFAGMEYKDTYERLQLDGQLSLGRAWGGFDLSFGAMVLDEGQRYVSDDFPTELAHDRMAGPWLSLGYTAIDGSRYAGAQRVLAARVDAATYPEALSTLIVSITDLRADVRWRFAPPLSRRHTFELRARTRALLGLEGRCCILQVGGAADVVPLLSALDSSSQHEFMGPDLLVSFYEPLRGYEDYALALERVGFADATYTYPIILDHGFATTLYLLPAFFLRQIDVELFGAAAIDYGEPYARRIPLPDEPTLPMVERKRFHGAAGGALTLHTVFWRVPVDLKYQIARRFADDHAISQEFGLGLSF
jgi:hypothetical protein